MPWEPLGKLFDPVGQAEWYVSHAALPSVVSLSADRYRVFFSGRDERNRARVGWFDAELTPKPKILRVSRRPAVDLGPLGAFDDSGITHSCVVRAGDRLHLFYTGWMLGVTVPFYFAIGHAVSDDGGETFQKLSAAPRIDRSDVDPYLVASPAILIESDRWRCWYVSAERWEQTTAGLRHHYHIRYAESEDGVDWHRTGHVCIGFKDTDEFAHGRPCVVKVGDQYRMWFCARGAAYRLACAESDDGLTWRRRDELAALSPLTDGFDTEMQCYPWVFAHDGRRYMLYNGNGYGRSGIGLAREVA